MLMNNYEVIKGWRIIGQVATSAYFHRLSFRQSQDAALLDVPILSTLRRLFLLHQDSRVLFRRLPTRCKQDLRPPLGEEQKGLAWILSASQHVQQSQENALDHG